MDGDGLERMERLSPAGRGRAEVQPEVRRRGGGRLREDLPELEPLVVGQILDRSLDVLYQRFLACILPAFLIWVPAQAFLLSLMAAEPESPRTFLLQSVIELGTALFVSLTISAAVAQISYATLQGRDLGIAASLVRVLRVLPALFVVILLTFVLVVPGYVACFVPGIYLTWRFALAQVVVVLEGAGPITALRRSWRLTERGFWRWAGAIFLTALFTAPLQAGAVAFDDGSAQEWLRDLLPDLGSRVHEVLSWVLSAGLLAVPGAFGAVVVTVIYVDQRVRREAYDLSMRLERLEYERAAEGQDTPNHASDAGGLA